jgi:hypothetical protein
MYIYITAHVQALLKKKKFRNFYVCFEVLLLFFTAENDITPINGPDFPRVERLVPPEYQSG